MRKIIHVNGFNAGDNIFVVSWENGFIETMVVKDIFVETFMVLEAQQIGIAFTNEEGVDKIMKLQENDKIFVDETKAKKYSRVIQKKFIKEQMKENLRQAKEYLQTYRDIKEDYFKFLKWEDVLWY